MAKVELGPVISAVSGSVGSVTFNRGPGITKLYQKPLPLRHPSAAQLEHRSFIAMAAAAWSALDKSISKAWNTLARTEQIPSQFSQGRRWTGRQLFFCFFLYAERQYTPLPSNWLPKPPLFHPKMYADVQFWNSSSQRPDERGYSSNNCYGAIPTSLTAEFPVGYTYDCVISFYLAIVRPGVRSQPRCFRQIAPAPPNITVLTEPAQPFTSGYHYSSWHTPTMKSFGFPPGVAQNTEFPMEAGYNIACRALSLTNERIYFTPVFFGVTSAQWPVVSNLDTYSIVNRYNSPPLVVRHTYPGNIPS